MGTFSRRQLPTAKRTGKRQGRLRRRGGNRDGRRAFGRLGAFGCDGQKKERGPALSGWPSLVRLYGSLPCWCSYTIPHFVVVVNNFLVAAGGFRWLLHRCCLRASPRGAPPPTGGRGVGSRWPCCPTGHNAARSVRRGRHLGGPSAFTLVARGAAALSARVGFPLPDNYGRLWGFCGCRRDWAEPIGAARCSRGDARDKKGLDKIGGVWYGVGCREHFAKSMFSEI